MLVELAEKLIVDIMSGNKDKKEKMEDAIVRQILGLDNPKPRNTQKYKGVMCFDHKTGGTVQVMTANSYEKNKQYYVPTKGRSAMKRY